MEVKTVITEHHVDDASSLVSAWVTEDDAGRFYVLNPKGSNAVAFAFHNAPPSDGRLRGITVPAILAVALTELRKAGYNGFAERKLEEAIASFKQGPADTMPPGEIIEAKPKKKRGRKRTADVSLPEIFDIVSVVTPEARGDD